MTRLHLLAAAGALSLLACKTEPAVDAGHGALASADAGAATTTDDDAGAPAGDVPPRHEETDAGAAPAADEPPRDGATDAGAAAAGDDGGGGATSAHTAEAGKASVFDRLLIKPKDRTTGPDDVKALVEKTLGVKVVKVRRTAVRWVLVTLAPASRTSADQKAAIDKLRTVDKFAAVEGDRLMKVR